MDCTNPLNSDLTLIEFENCKSAAEIIADRVPQANVVKAFNTTGSGNMMDAMFGIEQATMFICGNDKNAKKTVKLLAVELGFEVIDAGELDAARNLEALAMLWISLAYKQQLGPNIAFKLLKR